MCLSYLLPKDSALYSLFSPVVFAVPCFSRENIENGIWELAFNSQLWWLAVQKEKLSQLCVFQQNGDNAI